MNNTACYIAKEISAVQQLHQTLLLQPHHALTIHQRLSIQVDNLLQGHRHGNSAVVFHLTCWCPELIGQPAEKIMSGDLSLQQAQTTIAREYGYSDWDSLPDQAMPDAEFEDAVDAMLQGQLDDLRVKLAANESLALQVSAYGHGATLLHYLGANGVETHRQACPYNAVALATLLLQHGADPQARANIYGGSTAVQLVETSAHPAQAGVTQALVQTLNSAPDRA
ncbi:MAG: hypothetical protein AAF404_20235 [Pseudomonadota bacterium]